MKGVPLVSRLLLLVLLFSAGSLIAENIDDSYYDVYYGDVNGDGVDDIYLKARDLYVMIHGEVVVPLVLPPINPSYLYASQGGSYGSPVVSENIDISLLKKVPPTSLQYLDYSGDGNTDLYIAKVGSMLHNAVIAGGDAITPDIIATNVFIDKIGNLSITQTDPANDLMTESLYRGKLTGQHLVGKDGSFNYTIPIEVPPGINGLQPQVNLNYNSNRRNGVVGWGWDIGGQSKISRCRASKVRDGAISGINKGDAYKFCLDGHRLVQIGSGSHGGISYREYRTESESFQRLRAYGGEAAVPDYWRVESRDGGKIHYGAKGSANTEFEDGYNKTLHWRIAKREDVFGNYMVYTYEKDTSAGVHRISQIDYTKHNVAQGTNNALIFTYEPRVDVRESYIAGRKHRVDKRLKTITVKSSDSHIVRLYSLNYQAVDGNINADPTSTSKLQNVTLCYGGSTTDCGQPLSFDWSSSSSSTYANKPLGSEYRWVLDEVVFPEWLADFNGDYKVDYPVVRNDTLYVKDATGTLVKVGDVSSPGTITYYQYNRSFSESLIPTTRDLRYFGFIPLDINGDGKLDLIANSWMGLAGTKAFLNTGSGYVYSGAYSLTSEQITLHTGSSGSQSHLWPETLIQSVTAPEPYRLVFKDMNGDGLVDVFRYGIGRYTLSTDGRYRNYLKGPLKDRSVALNTGSGFSEFAQWWHGESSHPSTRIGDINGDGLPDMADVLGNVSINTGNGFILKSPEDYSYDGEFTRFGPAQPFPDIVDNLQLQDMNGDGLADMVFSYNRILYSTGDDWVAAPTDPGIESATTQVPKEQRKSTLGRFLVDYNGDGLIDKLYIVNANCEYLTEREDKKSAYLAVRFNKGETFSSCQLLHSSPKNYEHINAVPDWRTSAWLDLDRDGMVDFFADHDGSSTANDTQGLTTTSNNIRKPRIESVNFDGREQLEVQYRPLDTACDLAIKGNVSCNLLGIRQVYDSHDNEDIAPDGAGPKNTVPVSSLPYVVTILEESNGIGGTTAAEYKYESPVRHRTGYGSLGFARVIETVSHEGQAKKIRTVSEFHQVAQDNYLLAGQLKRQQVCAVDGSYVDCFKNCSNSADTSTCTLDVLSDTKYRWKIRTYSDDVDAGFSSPHYFPYVYEQSTVRNSLYNGSKISDTIIRNHNSASFSCSPVENIDVVLTTTSDVDYHTDGVLLNSHKVICDTYASQASVTAHHKQKSQIFSTKSDDSWILGLPERVEDTASVGASSTSVSSKKRTTAYSYNNNGTIKTKTIEPEGSASLKLITTYGYNNYGSISSIAESFNSFAYDGLDFTVRAESYIENFDANGIRKVTHTNPKGQSAITKFSADFGLPFEIQDLNNLITKISYDSVGRVDHIDHPDNTRTDFDYRNCGNSCFSYNPNVEFYIQSKTTGSPSVRTYFDSFERELGNRTKDMLGAFIYSYQAYNGQGLITSEIAPFYNNDPRYKVSTKYDLLGREELKTKADSSTVKTTYKGLETVVAKTVLSEHSPSEVQTTKLFVNGAGWTMKTLDNAGTQVDYTYWPFGDLQSTKVDNDNNTLINIEYDILGRKTLLSDPNTGTVLYDYNPLGLIAAQTDAEGYVTRFSYDKLERTIARTDNATAVHGSSGLTHSWTYDDKLYGIGLLGTLSGYNSDGSAYTENYSYSSFSQPESVEQVIDGKSYITRQHYDSFNRAFATTYPTGYTIANHYNSHGHMVKVKNAHDGQVLWSANSQDARGNLTEFTLGNGVVTKQIYKPTNGYIDSVVAKKGSFLIQSHEYDFDSLGNLDQRRDNKNGLTQSFYYDSVNRLSKSCFTNCIGAPNDFSYDVLGNVKTLYDNSDIYQYGQNGAGPNAVTSARGYTNYYNQNGSLTSSTKDSNNHRAVDYTAFNKPTRIENTVNGVTRWSEITYGPDQSRVKRTDSSGRSTIYASLGVYEETTFNGILQKIHYVGDYALYIQEGDASSGYYLYQHRDHIGSIVAKSGANADSNDDVQWMSNGPWGKRRDTLWNGAEEGEDYVPFVTARGYTDHEHLDGVQLIHMNGRVYDPSLGRFLSPDPFIQSPKNSQSYNRYSYVLNNPLSLVDPTGYMSVNFGSRCNLESRGCLPPCAEGGSCPTGPGGRTFTGQTYINSVISLGQSPSASGFASSGGGGWGEIGSSGQISLSEQNGGINDTIYLNDGPPYDDIPTLPTGNEPSTIDYSRYALKNTGREVLKLLQAIPGEGQIVGGAIKVGTFLFVSRATVATSGLAGNPMFKHAVSQFKRAGWTHAGRAATKHPNVLGVNVPKAQVQKALIEKFGSQAGVNRAAADALKNIMRNGTRSDKPHKAYGNVTEFKLDNGIGARFNSDTNEFIGFLGRGL
ncbi:hypothetical protein Misp06_02719 [Microbulbifer sp. NBRC 101763]|uniref:RHS repeat-associated core domain-containing protein n=1 Tax=Microbulbifer sp. NBRC 101763 TaxID=1113820 RepID=UPI00309FE073